MQILKKSPILQSVTSTGKKKFWQGVAYKKGRKSFYKKIWWQDGSKVQESTPVEVKGKNIGRSNETTAEQQAQRQLDSIINKQRDKGYSETGSKDHIPIKPMLAHKYVDKAHLVEFPCFVQPKLDGFRMLKEGDGSVAWTRGGKPHVHECVKHLMWDTGDYMVDGELILPHMPPLQETASAAKRFKSGVSETLMYWVYDVVLDMAFSERIKVLRQLVRRGAPKNVKVVETIQVNDEAELFEVHEQFVENGFEGTIIRSGNDPYKVGHQSNSLLKLKDFFDAEFRVVGVVEGEGSFKGKAIFECITDEGKTFRATPEGSMEHRAELYRTRDEHIGKWLTVRYPTVTKDNKPSHAVAVDFREEGEF